MLNVALEIIALLCNIQQNLFGIVTKIVFFLLHLAPPFHVLLGNGRHCGNDLIFFINQLPVMGSERKTGIFSFSDYLPRKTFSNVGKIKS